MTTPAPDEEPIAFINVFDIPEDEIDTFISQWQHRSRLMTSAAGFISAELHRATDSSARFQIINVTQWESMAHFQAATQAPEYRAELHSYQKSSTWTPYRGFYRTAAKFDRKRVVRSGHEDKW